MKFSKFVMVLVLTLTLVFGSGLAVYAYDISVETDLKGAGVVTALVIEAEGVYTAQLEVVSTNPGYRFNSWKYVMNNNWFHLSSEPKYDFILVDDMEVIAYFESVHNVAVTYNGEGDYTITQPHNGYPSDGEYAYGENIVITPLPEASYHFVEWTYNGGAGKSSNPIEFTMPNDDVEIRLTFFRDSFMLTEKVSPENSGIIYYTGNYLPGEVVTLNAFPEVGYAFVDWSYDSKLVEPVIVDNEMTFTMPNSNIVITANFIPNSKVAATIKYVNTGGISIQDDEQIEIPNGPYNQIAPAISGYLPIYSLGNVGTLVPFDDPIVITHIYMAISATSEPTTDSTTEPTTEPRTEPGSEPRTEPSTGPTTGTTTEQSTEPTIEPSTGPTNEPMAEPTSELAIGPIIVPTTTGPTFGPIIGPTFGPTFEPIIVPITTGPTTGPPTESTNLATEPTTLLAELTTVAINEPATEFISEEVLPLGPLNQIFVDSDIIDEDPQQTSEENVEIILDEDVPLAEALKTKYLPFVILLGVGSLIGAAFLLIKGRK